MTETPPPTGKLREHITLMEMTLPPWRESPPADVPPIPGLRLKHERHLSPRDYLGMYRRVGAPWLWQERLHLAPAALDALLIDPDVEIHFLRRDDHPIGLVELDRRVTGEVEIAYFGLIPEAVGQGLGRYMMTRALVLAWGTAPRPRRVWVHTCQHDHPGAIDFYRRSGFSVCGHDSALIEDPRLSGLLPLGAAPHVPLATPKASEDRSL